MLRTGAGENDNFLWLGEHSTGIQLLDSITVIFEHKTYRASLMCQVQELSPIIFTTTR